MQYKQNVPQLLQTPKVHYRIHKALDTNLSQLNPTYTHIGHFYYATLSNK